MGGIGGEVRMGAGSRMWDEVRMGVRMAWFHAWFGCGSDVFFNSACCIFRGQHFRSLRIFASDIRLEFILDTPITHQRTER